MEKLNQDNKRKAVVFLTPETLERILKVCNFVEGLEVKTTDNEMPKLVWGELKSIIEIPKGGGDVEPFKHPFKLSESLEGVTMSPGRVQLVNYEVPSFVTVEETSFGFAEGCYYWIRVEHGDPEEPAAPVVSTGSGTDLPTDARAHEITYAITIVGGEGAETYPTFDLETTVISSQGGIHYYIIGQVIDGEIVQFITSDVTDKWSPITKIETSGTLTTIP